MNELTSLALKEPLLPKPNEISQESHLNECKLSETNTLNGGENTKIIEYINDGLLPEQIDNRLDANIQQPEVQRLLINEFSPYSEQLNSYVRSTQELSVYTRNGLQESQVNDRSCLQMKIDPECTDAMGRTNAERMAAGRAPIDENGDAVNLHHIGQKEYSPLAELPDREHKVCDAILHDKSIPTEVHGPGNNWDETRNQYWKERSLSL